MLRLGSRTGYDIKQKIEISTRFFWGASYGQIYPELKRLAAAGLVEAAQDPRGGVKRTAYRLTPAGERVLHEWLTDRGHQLFEMRDEALLKIFFGDLLTDGGVAREHPGASRVVRADARAVPRDRRHGRHRLGAARVADRGAALRAGADGVDARLVRAEGARAHSSSTTSPAGGNDGSAPPLSSAAIRPQSGWWPTTTTSSPRPATAARSVSAVAPGASRSSASDVAVELAGRARRPSRVPASRGLDRTAAGCAPSAARRLPRSRAAARPAEVRRRRSSGSPGAASA